VRQTLIHLESNTCHLKKEHIWFPLSPYIGFLINALLLSLRSIFFTPISRTACPIPYVCWLSCIILELYFSPRKLYYPACIVEILVTLWFLSVWFILLLPSWCGMNKSNFGSKKSRGENALLHGWLFQDQKVTMTHIKVHNETTIMQKKPTNQRLITPHVTCFSCAGTGTFMIARSEV